MFLKYLIIFVLIECSLANPQTGSYAGSNRRPAAPAQGQSNLAAPQSAPAQAAPVRGEFDGQNQAAPVYNQGGFLGQPHQGFGGAFGGFGFPNQGFYPQPGFGGR